MGKGPSATQGDFGNPTVTDGTALAFCVYDDADARVAALAVDRAGESCGTKPCWKALGGVPGGRGFAYKDSTASATGVSSIKLSGGTAGKSSLSVSGANKATKGQTALPTGIVEALSDADSVTLQLHTSDAGCFSATLSDVSRREGSLKAR